MIDLNKLTPEQKFILKCDILERVRNEKLRRKAPIKKENIEAQRLKQREATKRYYQKNKEYYRVYAKEYRRKQQERRLANGEPEPTRIRKPKVPRVPKQAGVVKTRTRTKEVVAAYYQRNREKILQHKKEYYKNNREKFMIIKDGKEKRKNTYYERNREKILLKSKQYRTDHKDEVRQRDREYYHKTKEAQRERHIRYYNKKKQLCSQKKI